MAPSNLNASCTPQDHVRDSQATNIHHTSGSAPDHLSPVHDNPTADQEIGTQNQAPEHPQQYWQNNESAAGLQVVPEQPGLQVVEDKEAAFESVDELRKRKKIQRWMRRQACGVPFWTLTLLAILLIIGAIVGGILGGLKKKEKDTARGESCHLVRNSTICGTRSNTFPAASSGAVGTPHSLPINGTWYYLTNRPSSPPDLNLDLALSISPTNAVNVTTLGTQTNVSSELWTFVNFEDVALINSHDYYQTLAQSLRTYRRKWNITNPLYVIESGVSTNRTYLKMDRNEQPYITQEAPYVYIYEEDFWYLEDRWEPGDFLIRNGKSRNATALAVWDVRDGAGRLIMTPGADEIKANGAWRIVPFGSV